ncbi:MAG TPA: zf-HC2 domain-containing protein [Chthonomonadaceae bacterium]|nr:zf-HC2 domain-containing protein [Chthonomonadaceae bacterium]
MARYARRKISPQELLAVDNHIAGCAPCRCRLAEAIGLGTAVMRLGADLEVAAAGKPAHLSYSQLAAYAAGKLDAFDHEDVEAHLMACAVCAARWAEISPLAPPLARVL